MLFRVEDIDVQYGKVKALHSVCFDLEESEIVTIIGANGAGKSSTLRAISGLVRPTSGAIWFRDERIDKLAPEKIVLRGVAHVPEGRRVFPELSIFENLQVGAFLEKDSARKTRNLEQVFNYFPRLAERQSQAAKTMSGGEQQMLAIGRALMSSPELLLLDEPSLGLSPKLTMEVVQILKEINSSGVSIILVEQNADLALRLADKGVVLETGRVVLEGMAFELHRHEHVRSAYLGG